MDPIMGSIMIFAGNFAPRGWALCNGQLMSIAQNSALFSLLGTTYGGDGVSTFALPNMQGRSCLHVGNGPGINATELGQMGGANTVSILASNLPSAPVNIKCSSGEGTSTEPIGNVMAASKLSDDVFAAASEGTSAMAPAMLVGGNSPLGIATPFLVMNWCIATEGIYPSRP